MATRDLCLYIGSLGVGVMYHIAAGHLRIHRGGLSQKEQIILSVGTSNPSKNGTSFLPHLSLGWGKRSFWRRRLVLGFRVRVRDPLAVACIYKTQRVGASVIV